MSSAMSLFDTAHMLFTTRRNYASISYRSRDIASFLSNVTTFSYPMCTWRPCWGMTPLKFHQDLWHQKTRFPALSCGVLCDSIFSRFGSNSRLVTNRRPDRQTHDHSKYRSSTASCSKNGAFYSNGYCIT